MHLLEELDTVIALYKQQQRMSDIQKEVELEDTEDLVRRFQKVAGDYETVHTIMIKSLPMLIQCRDYFVENDHTIHQYEDALDNKGLEHHNQADIILKLEQKVVRLENECDRLQEEMAALLDSTAEKDRLLESHQERIKTYINQLKDQNAALTQHSEHISRKYKNLELIVDDQLRKKDQLEAHIGRYSQYQNQLIKIIERSSKQISAMSDRIQLLQKIVADKQIRIEELQYPSRENQQKCNYQNYADQINERLQFQEDENNQVATQIKLLQLSEQISFHQKPIFYLQQYNRNSFENTPLNSPRQHYQYKQNYLNNNLESTENKMRRVASNIELSQRKHNNQINAQFQLQIKPQPHQHKLTQCFSQVVVGIHHISDNKLLTISEHKQQFGSNMIIQTQVTEGQWDLSQPGRKRQQTGDLSRMDPYYIHYLLTVQGIKIEQDEDGIYGILEIDMKQYYPQIIKANLPISRWGEWVRDKLLSIHEQLREQTQ